MQVEAKEIQKLVDILLAAINDPRRLYTLDLHLSMLESSSLGYIITATRQRVAERITDILTAVNKVSHT